MLFSVLWNDHCWPYDSLRYVKLFGLSHVQNASPCKKGSVPGIKQAHVRFEQFLPGTSVSMLVHQYHGNTIAFRVGCALDSLLLVHTNDTAIRRRPGCLPQSTQSPGCEDVTGDIALIAHRAWTRQQLTTTTKTISTDNGRATRWTAVAARDAINTCHRAHTEPANVTLHIHRFSTSWNSL